MPKQRLGSILAAAIVVTLSGTALAEHLTVTIPMQDVSVREDVRADSYVVKFDLPADLAGKRLDAALFNFVVDATPTSEADAQATPFVAVYPLTAAAVGASLEYQSHVPSVRPVAMDQGQRVRADITDVVKGWIANPSTNHGLVISTPAEFNVATVTLKSSGMNGAAVEVTFYYQNRSGERVPTKPLH